MKNFFYLILCAICFAGCNSANSYTITGKVTESSLNGQKVELCTIKGAQNVVVNSGTIKDGRFSMKGTVDTAFVGTLRVQFPDGFPYLQPVAIEHGSIQVLMGNETVVCGTPMNDKLQRFLIAKDSVLAVMDDSISESRKQAIFSSFIATQVKSMDSCAALSLFIKESYLK